MDSAVFLDRDNTLIANDGDLGDPSAVALLPGVADSLKALREAGYRLIVVTNQGGVARGVFSEADVDAVHQEIARLVDDEVHDDRVIDRFYYCPYHPKGSVEEYAREHPWRKPSPGMLLQAARDMHLDLTTSWMVGDQSRDIAAGRAAGCRTILLSTNGAAEEVSPTAQRPSLPEAIEVILSESTPRPPARPRIEKPRAKSAPADSPARDDLTALRRAVLELAEEVRAERVRRGEFTTLKMMAGGCQLLVLLFALMGCLEVAETGVFIKWMMAAGLMQLLTLSVLLLDQRG